VEILLKRITCTIVAVAFGFAMVGCNQDINKNVPKSLPPGAKPFQPSEKSPGSGDGPTQSRIK
jgi:hypothetical protein